MDSEETGHAEKSILEFLYTWFLIPSSVLISTSECKQIETFLIFATIVTAYLVAEIVVI